MSDTPRTDQIALRLTGKTGLFCDDESMEQYNDLVRLARQLERELATTGDRVSLPKEPPEAWFRPFINCPEDEVLLAWTAFLHIAAAQEQRAAAPSDERKK